MKYEVLDHPEISNSIFHPRQEWGGFSNQTSDKDHLIPVAPAVHVGARFHTTATQAATILFFHGNGEIASDYDDLGPLYNQLGINFVVADYRGYGRSSGRPTVSAMMADAHVIFDYLNQWRSQNQFTGPLLVMGRSLGSASALELASARPNEIAGLIIESGFALAEPLLRLLGVDVRRIGFREELCFRNVDKIMKYSGPTLIIHAQHDHIIPFTDGRMLYEACGATQKKLLQIDGANHNDIFMRGLEPYLQAVKDLIQAIPRK